MKKLNELRYFPVLLILFSLLPSCASYFYNRPQPVDVKDVLKFPKQIRGTWLDEDSTGVFFGKQYVDIYIREQQKIIRGHSGEGHSDNGSDYYYMYSLKYDSVQQRVDTVIHYLERNGFLYEVEEGGNLNRGYAYRTDGDTLIRDHADTITIDLGRNAFLRPLRKDLFVLNIKASVTGESENWWTIYVFGINPDGSLTSYSHSDKLLHVPEMFYHPQGRQYGGNYYFDAYWTKDEMLRMFREGYFSAGDSLRRR